MKLSATLFTFFLCACGLSAAELLGAKPEPAGESLATLAAQVRPEFLLGSFGSGLDFARPDVAPRAEFFRRNFNILTAGVYVDVVNESLTGSGRKP